MREERNHNSATLEARTSLGVGANSEATALFVSGSPAGVSSHILHELAAQVDFVLAVDAGANQLEAAGITPDLLIGDFDSISPATLARFKAEGVPIQSYDPYKNATDVELGIETLCSRGYQRLITTNVLGGRTDHILGSLGALAGAAHERALDITLRDEQEMCYFLSSAAENRVLELDFEKSLVLGGARAPLPPAPHPQYVSLIAWGGSVTVSLNGTEWELDRHVLDPRSALGVSNLLRSSVLRLEVHEGCGTVLLLLSY